MPRPSTREQSLVRPTSGFSLVLCTRARTEELARFLVSLAAQDGAVSELIVVDQNDDDRVERILRSTSVERFQIKHLRSKPGLSRARNVGLAAATGELLAFPDDDCIYPSGLLAHAAAWMEGHLEVDILTGRSIDSAGRSSMARWSSRPGAVSRRNVWTRGISFAMFVRRRVTDSVGGFDESLGVGAGTPWGSGEETDFLLRAISAGFTVHYHPALAVQHDARATSSEPVSLALGTAYGAGMRRVLEKHGYPRPVAWYYELRALLGAAVALIHLDSDRARWHLAVLRGRAGRT